MKCLGERFGLTSPRNDHREPDEILVALDQDRLTDVSCTKVLEKGLPNSTTVVMDNCGHLPMVERPEEAASHYLSFLKS